MALAKSTSNVISNEEASLGKRALFIEMWEQQISSNRWNDELALVQICQKHKTSYLRMMFRLIAAV